MNSPPRLRVPAARERLADRPHPAAHPIARLEHDHRQARAVQLVRGGEPRQPRTHDHDARPPPRAGPVRLAEGPDGRRRGAEEVPP